MDKEQFDELERGDMIRQKDGHRAYEIIHRIAPGRYVAIDTMEATNPAEWELAAHVSYKVADHAAFNNAPPATLQVFEKEIRRADPTGAERAQRYRTQEQAKKDGEIVGITVDPACLDGFTQVRVTGEVVNYLRGIQNKRPPGTRMQTLWNLFKNNFDIAEFDLERAAFTLKAEYRKQDGQE